MNARDAALVKLDAIALPGWEAGTLSRRIRTARLDPRDEALAETIYIGSVKNALLLQHLIESISGRRLNQIDPTVQKILAIAIYQLRFLDRVPKHAAVDEGVEQAKRLRLGKASGFVNAILRKASSLDLTRFEPDESDTLTHLQAALSHPPELAERLIELMGDERAIELARQHNAQPPLIVRLIGANTVQSLIDLGIDAINHETPGMAVILHAPDAAFAKMIEAGIAQPQDPTSAKTVSYMHLNPGLRVLDRCCGRGTKTRQILDQVDESGFVLAMDSHAQRIASLEALKLPNLRVESVGRMKALGEVEPFDRVLIDAPCSNSGVLGRRPEARYAQSSKHIADVVRLQKKILKDTLDHVAPDGLLVYATCSIWQEENQQIIDWIMSEREDFVPVEEWTTLPEPTSDPSKYRDGGYVAILKKV